MRTATRDLIGYCVTWSLIAACAVFLGWGLFGCLSAPEQPVPPATPTTTAAPKAPTPGEIIKGNPTAGATSSEWLMWACGLAVPVGIAMSLYPPLSAFGLPIAAGGAGGSLWHLGLIQHGALLGWIALGVIVAGLIVGVIVAIRRARALADASMQGIEAHKAQLSAILADPAHPEEGSLWDRLTSGLSAQYKAAGVDAAAKSALVRLGFSKTGGTDEQQ